MTRLLIAAATVLALSATMVSAQAATRHKNARPLYDQVTTDVGVNQAPMLILGVAY